MEQKWSCIPKTSSADTGVHFLPKIIPFLVSCALKLEPGALECRISDRRPAGVRLLQAALSPPLAPRPPGPQAPRPPGPPELPSGCLPAMHPLGSTFLRGPES